MQISYIGMHSQEVAIKPTLRVVLKPDNKVLDEVVVTAIGIQRAERSLGYSVSKVDADEAIQKAEPDLIRSLEGKIPGVSISSPSGAAGSATRMTIRGNSSFLGNNQPLYVVDGVPYSNNEVASSNQATEAGGAYGSGISTLDPNDIESMNVLKGAAAAALYGSRAANGVILITTKSGSKSKKNIGKGTEITLNASYTMEKIAGLPDYQNKFGSGNNFIPGGSNGSWGAAFSDVTEVPLSIYSNNVYGKAYPNMPEMIPYKAYKDNVKDLFDTGGIYDLSLNLNRYTETGNFTTTLSRMDQDSYIPNAKFGRYAISVGGNQVLTNGLRIGGNVSYSRTEQNGPMFGNNQSSNIGASSFARALILGRNWDMSLPYETPDHKSLFFVGDQADNPLWSWEYNKIKTTMDRTVANVNLGYDITKWMAVDYRLGINDYKMDRKEVLNLGSRGLGGKGRILVESYDTQEIESTFLLRFDLPKVYKDFGLKATVGQNVNQFTSTNTQTIGLNIMSAGVYNINNTESQTSEEEYVRTRLWAIFGDLTLDYKNFAFLNITGRNDFSSTLPKNQRSFFYPSIAGSFVFTDAFNINEDIIKFGKVRLSWAKVGNDAGAYYKNGTFTLGQPFNGQAILSLPSSMYDPNLKPEFTSEVEFGAELQFLKSRVNLDFTWYNRNSTNQIAPLSLPYSTGYGSYYTNFGKLNNHGIEIGLNVIPVLTKDFKWDMYFTYTQNDSEVKELAAGVERVSLNTGFSTPGAVLEVGQPYGMLVGEKYARDEEGNILVDPQSGFYLVDNEEGYLGNPAPDCKMSLNNTFTYKGISLSFLLDAQIGGCVWSSYVTDLLGRGVTKDTENRYGSRILPGNLGDPETKKPLLDGNGNKIPNNVQLTESDLWFSASSSVSSFAINGVDEAAVYDATTFRLRELSIGYQLPKSWLAKTFIGSASVSFVARNLWYWAPNVPKHTNYDPTASSYGGGNVQGIDYTSAPNTRRYGFNLKLTF
ncbi:SusC/RagA family TonB-linked outer membrane protein [Bacteroides reticulotermitis]|nr:SusC/RagA family TonB-linked outer membrane protein [Bacteroides reticulotermitis]